MKRAVHGGSSKAKVEGDQWATGILIVFQVLETIAGSATYCS